MVVGEEDDLRDQIALAGDRLVVIAEIPAEAFEEGGPLGPSERAIAGSTAGLGEPGLGRYRRGRLLVVDALAGVLEQLCQRGERAAADLLNRRLELARAPCP